MPAKDECIAEEFLCRALRALGFVQRDQAAPLQQHSAAPLAVVLKHDFAGPVQRAVKALDKRWCYRSHDTALDICIAPSGCLFKAQGYMHHPLQSMGLRRRLPDSARTTAQQVMQGNVPANCGREPQQFACATAAQHAVRHLFGAHAFPCNPEAGASLIVTEAKSYIRQAFSTDRSGPLEEALDAIASRETVSFWHRQHDLSPAIDTLLCRTNNIVETANSQLMALFSETRKLDQRQVELVLRCLGAECTSTGSPGMGGCIALACLGVSLGIRSQVKQCQWLLHSGQCKDPERLGPILRAFRRRQ